jgi:hypothetical protein
MAGRGGHAILRLRKFIWGRFSSMPALTAGLALPDLPDSPPTAKCAHLPRQGSRGFRSARPIASTRGVIVLWSRTGASALKVGSWPDHLPNTGFPKTEGRRSSRKRRSPIRAPTEWHVSLLSGMMASARNCHFSDYRQWPQP